MDALLRGRRPAGRPRNRGDVDDGVESFEALRIDRAAVGVPADLPRTGRVAHEPGDLVTVGIKVAGDG
jgi:hypothetical protein